MADTLSSERRSENMRRIRSKGMSPEMIVRRTAHGLGYRFRLHRSDLPGKPDLVFSAKRKVIFVHGCFWHLHSGCREGRIPASRTEYWGPKLVRNRRRDKQHVSDLRRQHWRILVVWECELRNHERLQQRLINFLEG